MNQGGIIQNLCGDRIVLSVDCGGGYRITRCDKMAENYTHTVPMSISWF